MKGMLIMSCALLFCLTAAAQQGLRELQQGQPRDKEQADEALASQFFRDGDYAKAAALYQRLYYSANNSQRYYTPLLQSLMQLRDFQAAEKVIRKQAGGAPHNYRYQLDLGNLYKKSGDSDKAKQHFEGVIKNLPDERHLISGIAYSLYGYGESELAIEALQKGREKLDDPGAFAFELARLYYLDRQPSSVIHELLSMGSRSPEYLENIKGQLQYYLQDQEEFALLEEMLQKRMKRDRNNPVYRQLLIWRHLQQSNFDKALDMVIAMDKQHDQGQQLMQIAGISATNKDYQAAARAYKHLINKGSASQWYRMARIRFLDAKTQQLLTGKRPRGNLEELEKDYLSLLDQLGRSAETVAVMRQLARLQGTYLDKTAEAVSLLEACIALAKAPRFRAECKLELGDIHVLADEVWEATLLYGQVEKEFSDQPLGQEARFRNARLSYYIGEFEWARGQLDVLKSATSQLMANDALNLSLLISENPGPDSTYAALRMYAGAQLLAFRHRPEEALDTLDSIHDRFPGHALHDDILMAKAEIFTGQGKTGDALEALNGVINGHSDGIWADDALFELGTMYERELDDVAKAQECYEKILLQYPGSLYVTEARKRFRTLRGDLPAAGDEEFIDKPVQF